jgi:hypothetical protein
LELLEHLYQNAISEGVSNRSIRSAEDFEEQYLGLLSLQAEKYYDHLKKETRNNRIGLNLLAHHHDLLEIFIKILKCNTLQFNHPRMGKFVTRKGRGKSTVRQTDRLKNRRANRQTDRQKKLTRSASFGHHRTQKFLHFFNFYSFFSFPV